MYQKRKFDNSYLSTRKQINFFHICSWFAPVFGSGVMVSKYNLWTCLCSLLLSYKDKLYWKLVRRNPIFIFLVISPRNHTQSFIKFLKSEVAHQLDRLVLFADRTGLLTLKVKTQQSVQHYGTVFLLLSRSILNMCLKKKHISPSTVWPMIIAINIIVRSCFKNIILRSCFKKDVYYHSVQCF